jgi:hypothetical protein
MRPWRRTATAAAGVYLNPGARISGGGGISNAGNRRQPRGRHRT